MTWVDVKKKDMSYGDRWRPNSVTADVRKIGRITRRNSFLGIGGDYPSQKYELYHPDVPMTHSQAAGKTIHFPHIKVTVDRSGFLHSYFGKPAYVDEREGCFQWYDNGKLHRRDGPATIAPKRKQWFLHGFRHRSDGPAIEDETPPMWWVYGKQYSFEEFLKTLNVSDGDKAVMILKYA